MKIRDIIILGVVSSVLVGFLIWYNPMVGGFLGAYLLFFLVFQLYTTRLSHRPLKTHLFVNQEH